MHLCCPLHPKLFPKPACLPAQLSQNWECHRPGNVTDLGMSQTWACHTPAALAKPPVQCCALAVTKGPEVTSSNQRHGHRGKRDEYFLASSALWHTQHLFCLPAWAGGCTAHTTFSTAAQSSLAPCHYLSSSLPPYQELSFFRFTISDFFFHVHSQSILVLPVSFKEHNAGLLLHRI